MVVGIKIMISIGTSTAVSVMLGKNEINEANNTFNLMLFNTIIFGVLTSILAYFSNLVVIRVILFCF